MNNHFVLITRISCAFCDKAKSMIQEHGDTYTEKIIGKDIEREEVLVQYPSFTVLPIISLNGNVIGNLPNLLDFYNDTRKHDSF